MTQELAAALIAGLPRHMFRPYVDDLRCLLEADVLAALTAALDGVDERAGEVLERLKFFAAGKGTVAATSAKAADLITALLAQNAPLRAERDRYLRHLTAGAESLNAYKARAEAAEAERDALRKERDAQRRDLEKTIRNQRAELRRLQVLERVHWQSVERWKGTREGLEGKVKAAEAEASALQAEIVTLKEREEKLRTAAQARVIRNGEHLFNTAKSLGWADDGEGALEFVMRRTREVALEDAAQVREDP